MSTDFGFKASESDYYFVSYNTEDSERVGAVCRLLNQQGLNIWYDEGIPHDYFWESVLAEKISNCKEVILFITKGIFEKGHSRELNEIYTYKEYDLARIYKKTILFVWLDDISPQKDVPYSLISWWQEINPSKRQGLISINETSEKTAKKILAEMNDGKITDCLKPQEVQLVKLNGLSVLSEGRYLYLGLDLNQFSLGEKNYVVYDKQKKELLLLKFPEHHILGKIKCDPEVLVGSNAEISPNKNYVAIIKNNTLWIADIFNAKWIVKNKKINEKKAGFPLYFSWSTSNTFLLYCAKQFQNRFYVNSIIEVSVPSGKETATVIDAIHLYDVVCDRKIDDIEWVFFTSDNDKLVAVDIAKKTSVSAAWDLLKQYRSTVPMYSGGIDRISADVAIFLVLRCFNGNAFWTVYSVEDNLCLMQADMNDISGLALLNDYKVIYYDKKFCKVIMKDFKQQSQTTVLGSDFFASNIAFSSYKPIGMAYDTISNCFFFLATEENRFRIIVTDINQNILAISDVFETGFNGGCESSVTLIPDGCLISFYVTPDNRNYRDNAVNSYVYYIRFHHENGRLVFEK